jgi:superfamily II DNA or RNA helicase
MKKELRDYQIDYINAIDNDPHRSVLAVMPTGGGKTCVAGSIIKRYSSE